MVAKCHFEVMQDVKDIFYDAFKDKLDLSKYIRNGEDGEHFYIDAVGINIEMLKQAGLKEENIVDSGICDVCEADTMHSCRVQSPQLGKKFGRNAAIITLI